MPTQLRTKSIGTLEVSQKFRPTFRSDTQTVSSPDQANAKVDRARDNGGSQTEMELCSTRTGAVVYTCSVRKRGNRADSES